MPPVPNPPSLRRPHPTPVCVSCVCGGHTCLTPPLRAPSQEPLARQHLDLSCFSSSTHVPGSWAGLASRCPLLLSLLPPVENHRPPPSQGLAPRVQVNEAPSTGPQIAQPGLGSRSQELGVREVLSRAAGAQLPTLWGAGMWPAAWASGLEQGPLESSHRWGTPGWARGGSPICGVGCTPGSVAPPGPCPWRVTPEPRAAAHRPHSHPGVGKGSGRVCGSHGPQPAACPPRPSLTPAP